MSAKKRKPYQKGQPDRRMIIQPVAGQHVGPHIVEPLVHSYADSARGTQSLTGPFWGGGVQCERKKAPMNERI